MRGEAVMTRSFVASPCDDLSIIFPFFLVLDGAAARERKREGKKALEARIPVRPRDGAREMDDVSMLHEYECLSAYAREVVVNLARASAASPRARRSDRAPAACAAAAVIPLAMAT
jgi:hypothetical protein|tara:strand:- start:75 stop:422 length:348 start_codon:yes stop_codon:yes gene_type:complete